MSKGGEDGWTYKLQPLTSSLPTDSWTHTSTVTAPAGAVGLETGSDPLILLARNSNIDVVTAMTTAVESDHAHPGDVLKVSVFAFDVTTRMKLDPDADSMAVSLVRQNPINSTLEVLNTDLSTWSTWGTGAMPLLPLTASTGDPRLFQLTLTDTALWGTSDIVAVQGACRVKGTTYASSVPRELVSSAANGHAAYRFDGSGLVGFPMK